MKITNIFKKLAVFAASCALAFTLTGCGGMTLEKLMVEVDTALTDKNIQQTTIDIELDASVTSTGETQDIEADILVEAKSSDKPSASYFSIDINGDLAGENINETMQLYTQEEDGNDVSYFHLDSADMWTKLDFADSDTEAEKNTDDTEESKIPADLALVEETQIVDNRESYVLTCTFTGDELMSKICDLSVADDALSAIGLEDAYLDLNLTSLSIPTTIYIDMETYYPIKIEFDIQGLVEVIDGLMDSFTDSMLSGLEGVGDLGVDMSELEAEMGTSDMDISVNTFKIVMNEISFDPVEVPTVTEEGKEAATKQDIISNQYTFEADQGDGTYIIQETGNAVKVTIPEGYAAYDYGYNYVMADTEDESQEVSYYMYYNMMGQDFAFYVEQAYVPSLKEEGVYVNHDIGPKIGNFETMYIEGIEDTMLYIAWAPVGDGWVYIKMYDYENSEIETVLTPILEAVEEYEL